MILSQLGFALAARLRWVERQLELVVVSALPVGRRAPVVRLAPEAFTLGNDPLAKCMHLNNRRRVDREHSAVTTESATGVGDQLGE